MSFHLCPVHEQDAESLIRTCEWPAMRKDPLRLHMFPGFAEDKAEEECIHWMIAGLRESIRRSELQFIKVCDSNGIPVGFAGWYPEKRSRQGQNPKSIPAATEVALPAALDVAAWSDISKRRREERERVLEHYPAAFRLATISVVPSQQRRGIGSILVDWGVYSSSREELLCAGLSCRGTIV